MPTSKLKLWWRFVEADPAVDQEFFYRLPNRKAATIARSESGGFRTTTGQNSASGTLMVQGTSYVSQRQLAELVACWITERHSRVMVQVAGGSALSYRGTIVANPRLLASAIHKDLGELLKGTDAPIRVSAVELRSEASSAEPEVETAGVSPTLVDSAGHTPPDPLAWYLDPKPDDELMLTRVMQLDREHRQKALRRIEHADPSLAERLQALLAEKQGILTPT